MHSPADAEVVSLPGLLGQTSIMRLCYLSHLAAASDELPFNQEGCSANNLPGLGV